MVWTAPMRKLASSFGISDVTFAKHCKKAGIPFPAPRLLGEERRGQSTAKNTVAATRFGTEIWRRFRARSAARLAGAATRGYPETGGSAKPTSIWSLDLGCSWY